MDRVTLRRHPDGLCPIQIEGGWKLDAEHRWIAEGSPEVLADVASALGARVARPISAGVLDLVFGNAVGRHRAGPLGILHVHSGKWSGENYAWMLEDMTRRAAALPFSATAASSLPYGRTDVNAPDVLYHTFVWLRHALLEREDAPLLGALRAIVGDPHRRMAREERRVPTERATRLTARGLSEVVEGRLPLVRVARGRGLVGGDYFPAEVTESVARSTVDTAENRFVLAFLESCGFLVEGMQRGTEGIDRRLARRLKDDCTEMEGQLASIRQHRMWENVGRMHTFPGSSPVLQRRSAYREVLHHHMMMRMASQALPLDEAEVVRLLEVRDIAKLYEVWTAFVVMDAVTRFKGPPMRATRWRDDHLGTQVAGGLLARWADGTEVAYNASYSPGSGFHGRSWSLNLRPDVALWVPAGPSQGLHFFDAKFKRKPIEAEDDAESEAQAQSADLHKMHTYRDAIAVCRSAWVLYPGTTQRAWCPPASGGEGVLGIGEIPLVPGEAPTALQCLVERILGEAPTIGTDHLL